MNPHGDQLALLPSGILRERGSPFWSGKHRSDVRWREHRDGVIGLGRFVHLEHEVHAGPEIPRLDYGLVTRFLEFPGYPLCPVPV